MIKKLSAYVGEYKRWMILAPMLVILEVMCEIAMPRLMASIVDVGIANSDMRYILRQGGIMLILAGFGIVCGIRPRPPP